MFRWIIYSIIRNATIVVAPQAIKDGLSLTFRDPANEYIGDAQIAQAVLDRLGIPESAAPSMPTPMAPTPAPQLTTPAIQQAPSVQLNGPDVNNRPLQHGGPGRPRKLEGGRP